MSRYCPLAEEIIACSAVCVTAPRPQYAWDRAAEDPEPILR